MKKICFILLVFISCNTRETLKTIDSEESNVNFTSLFKTKTVNSDLQLGQIENVDIINGFRNAKIGTNLKILSFDGWSLDNSNIDLGLLVVKNKNIGVTIGNDLLHNVEATFIDDSLCQFKIRIGEAINYTKNLTVEYALKSTYGTPTITSSKELLPLGMFRGKLLMTSTTKETITTTWDGTKSGIKLIKEIFIDSEKPYDLPREEYHIYFYSQNFDDQRNKIEREIKLKHTQQEGLKKKKSMNEI